MILASSTITVNACELHANGGYANQFHPFARQHFQPPILQNFTLNHANQSTVKTGDENIAKFSYQIPKRYTNVNITFIASDAINLTSKPSLLLTRNRGIHHLKYVANQAGNAEIIIKIAGFLNSQPFSLEQKIAVSAS